MTDPVRRSPSPAERPRRDVVALVFGVLLSAVAVGALWQILAGSVNWNLVKIVAPLGLVVIGIAGLALSRRP